MKLLSRDPADSAANELKTEAEILGDEIRNETQVRDGIPSGD
jgi:hypothetical protein